MLATTLIRLFLRMISLWVGFLSLQRGILTGLFQDLRIVSAQLTIALSVLFLGLALLMWFLSGRLSRLIVEQDDRDTSLTWSSQAVVLSGIVLISLYTLFVDAIPVLFDYITRSILLFASGQYAYLANPSVLVPGIIAVIKIGLAIFIAMNARFISTRVTSVQ
jgi:hypothetical protein